MEILIYLCGFFVVLGIINLGYHIGYLRGMEFTRKLWMKDREDWGYGKKREGMR